MRFFALTGYGLMDSSSLLDHRRGWNSVPPVKVTGNKRPKFDMGATSESMDASLRLTLSPPGQQVVRDHDVQDHSVHDQKVYEYNVRNLNVVEEDTPYSRHPALIAESEPERTRQRRSRPTSVDRTSTKVREEFIIPPYPWATNKRAVVHSLDWITQAGILDIYGEVICKRCDGKQTLQINLEANFLQLDNFFRCNKFSMHDRAPKNWMVPRLLDCTLCHQSDCVKPVINHRKRHINWLFLVLTKTLGLCTLDQLKYFCKHTHRHRTGAKDRVLYLTYTGVLQQLNPDGPYD